MKRTSTLVIAIICTMLTVAAQYTTSQFIGTWDYITVSDGEITKCAFQFGDNNSGKMMVYVDDEQYGTVVVNIPMKYKITGEKLYSTLNLYDSTADTPAAFKATLAKAGLTDDDINALFAQDLAGSLPDKFTYDINTVGKDKIVITDSDDPTDVLVLRRRK